MLGTEAMAILAVVAVVAVAQRELLGPSHLEQVEMAAAAMFSSSQSRRK